MPSFILYDLNTPWFLNLGMKGHHMNHGKIIFLILIMPPRYNVANNITLMKTVRSTNFFLKITLTIFVSHWSRYARGA
jgi:hypothetical protein